MATLEWHQTVVDDVTLVRLHVDSVTPATVRIESCIDAPVWPPRRQGRPEAGWDDHGYEGVVHPDEGLVLGYATPGKPQEPPAQVTDVRPPEDDDAVTAADLVRRLGEAGPPREALPGGRNAGMADRGRPPENGPPSPETASGDRRSRDPDATTDGEPAGATGSDRATPPPAVEAWLDDVEERVRTAEAVADASSVADATAAVDDLGGIDAVRRLETEIAADRRALDRVARRGETLYRRLSDAEVPTDTLARLV